MVERPKSSGENLTRYLIDQGLPVAEVVDQLRSSGYFITASSNQLSISVSKGLYNGWDVHPDAVEVLVDPVRTQFFDSEPE